LLLEILTIAAVPNRFVSKSLGVSLLSSSSSLFLFLSNLGGVGSILETVIQSHNGEIHVLPVPLSETPTGTVKGIRARGGFELGISWDGGELVSATIKSVTGTSANIRYKDSIIGIELDVGGSKELTPADF
jgi:alpha-L-fucosidase 2